MENAGFNGRARERFLLDNERYSKFDFNKSGLVIRARRGQFHYENMVNTGRLVPDNVYILMESTLTGNAFTVRGWAFGDDEGWSRIKADQVEKYWINDDNLRSRASLDTIAYPHLIKKNGAIA